MLTQFVFYFLMITMGHARETPAQRIAQHPDFAPIWMQYTNVLLRELDQALLLIAGDSNYLIKWNVTGDGLLFREANLNGYDEFILESSRKGTWICTVAGAGVRCNEFPSGINGQA